MKKTLCVLLSLLLLLGMTSLAQADEAFITGSVKEILPVVRVGSQKIGSGRPGPAVQRLQHIFLQNMPKWLDK